MRSATRCGYAWTRRERSEIHDREPPADAPGGTHAAFELEADVAVHQERLARDKLADPVTAFAGPASCCLIVEGVVIALADDADGMVVVRADQVVRI
jgi:hypothetical protein